MRGARYVAFNPFYFMLTAVGSALLQGHSTKENIVIYIINPFTHSAALADICAAFWSLFQAYAANVDKRQTHLLDELVLQIIPLSFLASSEFLVVPSQPEYLSLALEVYSRCPPKDPVSNLVNSAPPTLIAQSIPKHISFNLTGENLSPYLEGKTLHVACSRSLDQRWVTAAWADNTGSIQRTLSYCLRYRNSSAGRSITDIRKEIWNATKDIMERIQARWRVIVVNTDPLDQEDIESKLSLFQFRQSLLTSFSLDHPSRAVQQIKTITNRPNNAPRNHNTRPPP